MHLYLCHACSDGMHSSCDGTRPAPPGVFGGSMCSCNCQQQPMENEPEKARSMLDMLKPRHMKKVTKCQWKKWTPDDFNTWDTSCGDAHCFIEGGVAENNYKFCPYCGGEIESI